ncbi:hypothetical protein BGZ95_001061 [Linnemannia exigua]|uniref:Uncharacterized protein n=1 Tax=Linnemannia exigua TaxID=604196 RepID=A0AAD4D7F9_9FUNG|nr:hypothetical protein BGZ95_001061 [Linnemannia exigua]
MMLPVIGVETRAVIRTKVAEVMQQIIAGLTHYEAVKKVIRTAVDDAGLVLLVQPPVTVEDSRQTSRRKRKGKEDDLFSMEDGRYEQISEYDDVDDEIPTTTTMTTTTTTTTPTIDESQIPVLTDIAMEAVLDYMAEILTPSLVIRQLTEAIQGALFEINKQRKSLHRLRVQQLGGGSEDEDGYLEDVNGDGDSSSFDLDDLSSQLLSGGGRRMDGSHADRHGIDLLSDGWILSGPSSSSSSSRSNGENSVDGLLEDEEDEDDDPRGQDEDLWDKDMEIHEWDSTGRLFDDFEDLEDNSSSNDGTDSVTQLIIPTTTEQDMENWDMATTTAGDDADDVEEEDEESSDPFSIGIRDRDTIGGSSGSYNDRDGEDEDEDDNDPMADTREDYGRERYLQQSYFNRFQKRSLFDTPDTTVTNKKAAVAPPAAKPATAASATTTTTTKARTIRRPNLSPDLRLENLLTQLIEPLLTTFIEEDFPASCKRVQGELMDGIIWSLDQGELSGGGGVSGRDGLDSDEERMLLLSELEY